MRIESITAVCRPFTPARATKAARSHAKAASFPPAPFINALGGGRP